MASSQNLNAGASDDSLLSRLRAELEEARQTLDRLQADYDVAITDSSAIQKDRDSLRALVEQARTHHTKALAAFHRQESGTYGICQTCGGEITSERLEAIPEATTCRNCFA